MSDEHGEAEILALLTELIGEAAGVRLRPNQNFFEAGLNSARLLLAHAALLLRIGTELPVWALFKYPTCRSLARMLTSGELGDPPIGALAAGHVPTGSPARSRRELRNRIRVENR